jgi:FlaA1/EpsC-like NDP-sugar epimerase
VTTTSSSTLAAYAGKCILITGAGGFIGSALAARLSQSAPRFLLALDNSEQNLYDLDLSLSELGVANFTPILGDVCDTVLLQEIMQRHRPNAIFHAAACKHVPLMECNPFSALHTNAVGTWRLANAAARAGVQHFLLISTDKAVKPASIMGATKRVAELALARPGDSAMRLQSLRLGNVLGSHGSVLPLFSRQIARGGPVTVTHAEAERYFFSLNETVQLILDATAEGPGAFIPQLPPPTNIRNLAEQLIRDQRGSAHTPIAIQITQMRPGDKLREEFLNAEEISEPTQSPQLLRVNSAAPEDREFPAAMARLEAFVQQRNLRAALEVLCALVPEYRPSTTILEQLHDQRVVHV